MGDERIGLLTERQKQCLRLVADNRKTKEIARILNIAPSTVDNHLNSATTLLGATRFEAARMLREAETGNRQELPRQPDRLAKAQVPAISEGAPSSQEAPPTAPFLPPLGGRINALTARQRLAVIARIILVAGLVGTASIIIAIHGLRLL